ncbi:MAG: hypothetical protein M0Q53_07980 [Prolixibacteraceae bacterium]|jgi:hypothetical protein|nr:hypothetical protein [Prolixibacteraceae bacterium]
MNDQKTNQNSTIYLHVIISLALMPIYMFFGETFKYLCAPYVFYLVWSEDPKYYPALIFQMASGTIISILILLICVLKTIIHYKKIKALTGSWLLLLAILPAPYLFYQSFIRYVEMDLGIIASFVPLSYYLGLFPFFYGILISKNFNDNIFKAVIYSIFFVTLLTRYAPIGEIRLNTFSLVLFLVIGFISLIPKKLPLGIAKEVQYLGLFSILLFFITTTGEKFHIVFSAGLSFFVLFFYLRKNNFLLNNLVKPRIFIVLTILVIYIISNTYNYQGSTDPSNFSYTKIADFPSYIMFKALGDRGPIWNGVWHSLLDSDTYFPPLEVAKFDYLAISGGIVENSDIPAHNIVLELLRSYGLIFGFLFSGIYVLMITKLAKVFRLHNQNPYVLLLSSVVFGIAIVVGMTGQFVLMPEFSFLSMGMAGICIGYIYQKQKTLK